MNTIPYTINFLIIQSYTRSSQTDPQQITEVDELACNFVARIN